jgi:signal transduction histidine kinase
LKSIRRFIRTVPAWTFALVFLVILVNTAFLIGRQRMSLGGGTVKYENGYSIHSYIKPGGPVYNAGIRPGDTIVSINSIPIEEWHYSLNVGDTAIAGIMRNNQVVRIPVAVVSLHSFAPGFFWSLYLIAVLTSIGSLYLLYKKSHELSARIFFIFIQLFMIVINANSNSSKDPFTWFALNAIRLSCCFLGPVLVHFHLLFPKPAKFLNRFKQFPVVFYILAFLIAIVYLITYHYFIFQGNSLGQYYTLVDRMVFSWMTFTFLLAVGIAIYQFMSVKDTLTRNQLRIVITGSVFGFIPPAAYALFYYSLGDIYGKYPLIMPASQGTGTFILIICILVAIFRFRIWDIELFLRKALLYFGATLVIILSYLLLLYLVDFLTIRETKVTRFIVIAVSVIIFLMLRDRLQKLIDRIFHRETYDSATVVSEFEEKLAGIYRIDELKSRIVQCLDEIFHFKSFVFNLRKEGLTYEPAYASGIDHEKITGEFLINPELENRLYRSKVFSPGELEHMPPIFEVASGELVVPLLKNDQPYGFFLCGPKKSEKTYSTQDIRVLILIARRVIALFHTAILYQKDIDRQLMLERERARISQDMHDDVGASLTRISMMSDLVRNMTDIREDARQWLGQISGTSREVTEEMDQIIWALNPKNDNLEGLASYIRRFASEYLEPTPIECVLNFPEDMPVMALSVEVRRNVYLVVREALHNVVKHSGATRVEIRFSIFDLRFSISVKDNGKGFEPEKPELPGNGLLNMKKRMNDIGGEVGIRSKAGEGTEIALICFT